MRAIAIGLLAAVAVAWVAGCQATRTETKPAEVGLKHVKSTIYPDGTIERNERSSIAKGDSIKTADPLKAASAAVVKANQKQASGGGEQAATAGGGEAEFAMGTKITVLYVGCGLLFAAGVGLWLWKKNLILALQVCGAAVAGAGAVRFYEQYPWAILPFAVIGLTVGVYVFWQWHATQKLLATAEKTERAVVLAVEQARPAAQADVKSKIAGVAGRDAEVVKARITQVKARPDVQPVVAGVAAARASDGAVRLATAGGVTG